jgi:phosphoglycerate dehydrogenase-like enzyme
MKPGAIFINVGRGCTVDERALVEALQRGRLAGAGLDVFEKEPLPPESPLWTMDNVLITPHVAGVSPNLPERLAEIFLDNLERHLQKRDLRNVVDRRLGY